MFGEWLLVVWTDHSCPPVGRPALAKPRVEEFFFFVFLVVVVNDCGGDGNNHSMPPYSFSGSTPGAEISPQSFLSLLRRWASSLW